MPGLFQRGRRRSAATDAPETTTATAAPADGAPSPPDTEQPTAVVDPVQGLVPAPPAESSAELVPPPTEEPPSPHEESWRRRTKMRRRVRYLRRARELALRDLGGLVFDLDRFGRERPDLVRSKLDGLASLDAERRTLEAALGEVRDVDVLREPGVASCPRCGALHSSDAHFCSACGLPVGPGAPLPAGAPAPEPGRAGPDSPEAVPGGAAATSDAAQT